MLERFTVLIIDKNRSTVEVELDIHKMKILGITKDKVKKNKTRVELNNVVNDFVRIVKK